MAIAELSGLDAVGRETARAWMDTTIQEALQILQFERGHVLRTEAGWRFRPPRSEYYAPLHRQMNNIAATNLEQMCERIDNLSSLIDAHDKAVQNLIDRCRQLADAIAKSTEFNETVTFLQREVESSQGASWDSYFGAYSDSSDRLQLLAGHIINRTQNRDLTAAIGLLPDNYTIAPLWNANRAKFMSVLHSPDVRQSLDEFAKRFTALEEAIENLVDTFVSIRTTLSIKHDLPYAAPPAA